MRLSTTVLTLCLVLAACSAATVPAPTPTPLPPAWTWLFDTVKAGARANRVDVTYVSLDPSRKDGKVWLYVGINTDDWQTKGFILDVGTVAGVVDSVIDTAPRPIDQLVIGVSDRSE